MDPIVLSLRQCMQGWRIFQGDEPLFWFPDYPEALATIQMVAETHAEIREVSALIEVQALGEEPVHIRTVTPASFRARFQYGPPATSALPGGC